MRRAVGAGWPSCSSRSPGERSLSSVCQQKMAAPQCSAAGAAAVGVSPTPDHAGCWQTQLLHPVATCCPNRPTLHRRAVLRPTAACTAPLPAAPKTTLRSPLAVKLLAFLSIDRTAAAPGRPSMPKSGQAAVAHPRRSDQMKRWWTELAPASPCRAAQTGEQGWLGLAGPARRRGAWGRLWQLK